MPSYSRVCDHYTAWNAFLYRLHAASASTDRAAMPANALDQLRPAVRSAGVGGRLLHSPARLPPSLARARSTCTRRPAGQRVMPLFVACARGKCKHRQGSYTG